ncbi:hypothetical protein AYL99_06951 [Fonsecaea erecta]|uniref:Uncharacterized protein n=1 Tax=Fonsecaea erecta TaxID=1367422 RepID=A0A178ZKD6_9EURO|nr:hypothetical protein AYL99_06951 [Fonsecaea erecta]OAP59653.1 hypothetical protein AYL99_06951 [Fonsecaea erecta]
MNTVDPSRKVPQVDQSAPIAATTTTRVIDMSTFGPTAPAPSSGNGRVFFHLGRIGHEATPKPFPVCISAGKGVIVRAGHLHGAWTCVRPFDSDTDGDSCYCYCSGGDDEHEVPRTITFPAAPGVEGGVEHEHKIRIVGSRTIEFSVLDASSAQPAPASTPRIVRLKVKALVAAANDEFSPTAGTEGVPIWIGVDDSPDNIFRAVPGEPGSWEVKCDNGEVVRF